METIEQRTTPFDRKDISPEKKLLIKQLHVRSDRMGILNSIYVAAMYAGAILLLVSSRSIYVIVPGTLLMSFAMIRGSFLMHDASHFTLFKHRGLNRFVGLIWGAPIGMPVTAYRYEHTIHHANARTVNDTGDLRNVERITHIHISILRLVMLFAATPTYIIQVGIMGLGAGLTKRRWDILFEYLVVALFIFALAHYLTFEQFERFYLIPFVVAVAIMNIRGLSEHEMTYDTSAFTCARTVLSTPLTRWLMCNENYHLEHHIYPGVPSHNLPKLHTLLAEEEKISNSSVYSGYLAYIVDLARISYKEFFSDMNKRIHGTTLIRSEE